MKGWKTANSVRKIPCHSLDKKRSTDRGCQVTENGMGRNSIPETLSTFLNTRRQTNCRNHVIVSKTWAYHCQNRSELTRERRLATTLLMEFPINFLVSQTNLKKKKNLQRQLQFIMKPYCISTMVHVSTLMAHHQTLVLHSASTKF